MGSVLVCGESVGGGYICIRMEVWKAGVSHCENEELGSGMLHKSGLIWHANSHASTTWIHTVSTCCPHTRTYTHTHAHTHAHIFTASQKHLCHCPVAGPNMQVTSYSVNCDYGCDQWHTLDTA